MSNKATVLLEELLAVEMLEYHNQNWLPNSEKIRSEKKQQLIREVLSLTTEEKADDTPATCAKFRLMILELLNYTVDGRLPSQATINKAYGLLDEDRYFGEI